MKGILFILMLNNLYNVMTCENILVMMPICFPSHVRAFVPIVEQLIRNGHNVTVVSTFPMADVQLQSQYTHVEVKTNFCHSQDTSDTIQYVLQMNSFTKQILIFQYFYEFSEQTLNLPELQRIINSQDHYDLVMAELLYVDAFFAFGYKFKAPVVALCPMNLLYFYSWILGNPYPSSYVPNQYLWHSEAMSLFSRISNFVYNLFSVLYYEFINLPKTQKQMDKFFNFDKDEVSIKDIMTNISLVLLNSHYSFGYMKPELPNVVNIAGLHYPSPNPLPQKMKTFMDEANYGVIYVSLGSVIKPRDFQDLGNTFIRELKNFPQRVVMKWDPELLTEIPENIFVEKWISQTQVLNHPNCRLFITHGGLHSTLESINASVPFVGIPLVADQFYNMAAAEHFGVGRSLLLDEVSDRLSIEIEEVLRNPKYKENSIKRSQLFRDRLIKPLDEAMYWIEHVMKHKTTTHLKSAAVQLTWYQFYGVDVLIIVLVVILSTVMVMKLLISWISKILYSRIEKLNSSVKQRCERKDYKGD